jgi:outer membrane protein insertion porin family
MHNLSSAAKYINAMFFLSIFIFQTTGYAQLSDREFVIEGVEIVGTNRVDPAAVKVQLRSAYGRVTEALISEDIRSIYRTGFFDQVSAEIQESAGKTVLRYTLSERPVVRKVFVKGNQEVSESDLADVIKFEGRKFLDKAKLDAIKKTATSYFQSQGFYDAEIDHSIERIEDNQVDVTFIVKEGDRYQIREVEFRGLENVDDSDLTSVIQTKTYKWWSSWLFSTGRLNRAMLDNDKALMLQYLLDQGYVDANISDPDVQIRDQGIYIAFDVQEGKKYKVGKVTVAGDLIDNDIETTIDGIKAESGEDFGAAKIREDAFIISEKFTDIGYAFANVVPNTRINREEGTIDLEYQIDKGKIVTINRISIRGNSKTYDNVIRRDVRVAEQEKFSSSKIKRSQELLQRLGYFEEVNITTEPSDQPDKVDLNVNVREGSTGQFSVGAGYATSDGTLFNASISENNILGTGRSVSLSANYGSQRNNIVFSLNDRRVNDTFLALGTDIYITNRQFIDFDRELQGAALSAGYPLEQIFGENFQDIQLSTKYEYSSIDISNINTDSAAPLVIQSEGSSTASAVIPSLVRNTINNPMNPTKGSMQAVSFEDAGLGGDQDYWLFEASQTLYQPLLTGEWGDITLAWRTRFGYGESRSDDPFPLFKRYFPGGINSVRGFNARTMGPKDLQGNEYGGSKQFINNFDLLFPLVNSAGLRGVLFYDIGNAFDDDQDIEYDLMREAVGYGIRWMSPMGPIRLEIGYPLDREDGEGVVTLFAFGAPI